MPEVACRRGERSEDTPHYYRGDDDVDAVGAVRQTCDRNTQCRIEGGEGQPAQQAQLPVMQPEFLLQRLNHNGQDLAVDEVECVDGKQEPDDVMSISAAAQHRS